jgi:hypothetical protein
MTKYSINDVNEIEFSGRAKVLPRKGIKDGAADAI